MSKYHNIKRDVDGIEFDSIAEANRYGDLKLLVKAGIIHNLELQKPYSIEINGVKICKYIADFSYISQDGKAVVEDVKGVRTPVYRLKCKLMLAVYGIRITEVA